MSDTTLDAAYSALEIAHSDFLAAHGVLLPPKETQQAVMLCYLYLKLGRLVSLEQLREYVRTKAPGSQDLQPRHLKYSGWHLLLSGKSKDLLRADAEFEDLNGEVRSRKKGEKLPNGYVMLVSVTDPSPDFVLKKRRGSIDRGSWEKMLASYDGCCAVCGKKTHALEKGHKDPMKGFELSNVIPMCSECNNWASNDLVFDDNGRVVALASSRLVMASDLSIKVAIFHQLRKDRTVNPGGR